LSYAYGFNLLPEVRLTDVQSDPDVGPLHAHVDLANARQHMVGADFARRAVGSGSAVRSRTF
jgi:hypothetical protein